MASIGQNNATRAKGLTMRATAYGSKADRPPSCCSGRRARCAGDDCAAALPPPPLRCTPPRRAAAPGLACMLRRLVLLLPPLLLAAAAAFTMMSRTREERPPHVLRVLAVSDVHDDHASVNQLINHVRRSNFWRSIDVVFCAGDLSTMPVTSSKPSEDDVREFHLRAQRILHALSALNKPIYFVPGNHDAPSLFNATEPHAGLRGVYNVHGRAVALAPDLVLLGWGGSSDALEGGAVVWPGHPYTEPVVADGLSRLLRHARRAYGSASMLLMSHCGPAGVSTTASTTLDNGVCAPGVRARTIHSGSPALRGVLANEHAQQRIVLALHGHTHAATGQARLGRVPVANVGSLTASGAFALIVLQRVHTAAPVDSPPQRSWRISSINQIELRGCFDVDSDVRTEPFIDGGWLSQGPLPLLVAVALVLWSLLLIADMCARCWRGDASRQYACLQSRLSFSD